MGMDFRGHAGLKMGVKNEIFWSEIARVWIWRTCRHITTKNS